MQKCLLFHVQAYGSCRHWDGLVGLTSPIFSILYATSLAGCDKASVKMADLSSRDDSLHACMYVCMYACMYMRVYMYVHVSVCVHVHVCVYIEGFCAEWECVLYP